MTFLSQILLLFGTIVQTVPSGGIIASQPNRFVRTTTPTLQKSTAPVPSIQYSYFFGCYVCDALAFYCIPQNKLCDGSKDCSNGADEAPNACALKQTTQAPVQRNSTASLFGQYWSYCTDGNIHCWIVSQSSQGCLYKAYICDGNQDCLNGEDEMYCSHNTTVVSKSQACDYNEIRCYIAKHGRYECLHNMYKCDGVSDCYESEDEDPSMCGNAVCNKRLEDQYGWFSSPNYPREYSSNAHCSWVIHQQGSVPSSVIQLRVVDFNLENFIHTDYVDVYDGPDNTYKLIGRYYGVSRTAPPAVIESTSNWMNVVFKSDSSNNFIGFNFTYQTKGECLPTQVLCSGENECYSYTDRCNGILNCPLYGADEIGCDSCKTDYTCGPNTHQCYHPSERCNGLARCSNSFDEMNCTSKQCGSHNGTFLCDNRRCIYESWICDQRDDCGDNSDESFCSETSKRVIIAAICGSMICALLLVILIGCSCKLYYLRHFDHFRHVRHETPMSRLYAEFMRRRAPPPYHEAMLTSRNFDEVQQEYLEQMRNSRQNCSSHRNRQHSRNSEAQADSGSNTQTQSTIVDETQTVTSGDSDSIQLHSLIDENQTLASGDNNSDPNQTDNESETDSADESETDLGEEHQGDNHGQIHYRAVTNSNQDADHDDDDDDSDDENILVSNANHWSSCVDADCSSDDRCILENDSPENLNASDSAPKIETNHAQIAVISHSNAEIPNNDHVNVLDDTCSSDDDSTGIF